MRKIAAILMIIPFLLFCGHKVGAVEKEERKWQDESMYFIMVDRFMNGDVENDLNVDPNDPKAYHGGDLQGIIDQLDYIKDMGFTSIRLTPIMDNEPRGYHGYWVKDFMSVDEHFGTMDDARRLVDEAHKRNMKVIVDFVVDHTGHQHPWLNEEGKEDWYQDEQPIMGEGQDQLENDWIADLPDLNTENPEVKQYLFEVAEYWIEETDVDGFGLDTVRHIPKDFWKDFSDHVKSVKEDFFLLGDVRSDDSSYVTEYQSTGIDSFVDYPWFNQARGTFKAGGEPLNELYAVWEKSKQYSDSPYQLGTFLDNLNQSRFTHAAVEESQNPITRWKLGLTYMFTTPGIPILYYGSEIPMDGGEVPGNRRMMNFKAGNDTLKKRIEKLTAMRDQYPALTRGDFEELYNESGLAIFKRSFNGESMIIAINNSLVTKSAQISDLKDDQQLRGLIRDGIVRQQDDGTYRIGMERETSDVFVIEPDQGYNWLFIGFVGGVLSLFVIAVTVISIKNRRIKE